MEPAEVESLLQIEDSSTEAWCDVFRRLIINRDKLETPENAAIICHALLTKVEDIGCEDKLTIWKIVDIITSWQLSQEFFIPESFHLTDPACFNFIPVNFSRTTSSITKLVQLSLRRSDVKVMRFLLNYGYLPYLDPIVMFSDITARNDTMETIWFCRKLAPELAGQVWPYESQKKLCFRVLRIVGFLKRGVPRCATRMMLLIICIRVLRNRNTGNVEQYVQCLRLYFRAVAYPFVTAEEVRQLLHLLLTDVSKDSVDAMVKAFKRLYPESQGPFRPRSLKHLCRCMIRQKLTDRSEVIPVLLDNLGVPSYLKRYIMGDS